MEKFKVKQYTKLCILKGNGFDGLELGDDRDDAEVFVEFVNILIEENAKLRQSLARCLTEAEGWLDEARGCKPDGVIGYDGWADEARKLLGSGSA